jgi:tRNA(Ile)-lysidine synthase
MSVEEVREQVRARGLLPRSGPLVAMLSGGRDSVCLLDLAVEICAPGAVRALHVNYGLRSAADGDERHCRELCRRLGVELEVVRAPARPADAGNLQAWARERRYREARRVASAIADPAARARTRGGVAAEYDEPPSIATGHTASDQVETVLYRLAASPGRRALLGMPAREGRLVRPLLELTREQTAAYCRARGLSWREDSSNEDERYARSRVRSGLVPALRAVHPAAEANVLRTAQLLRAEAEVLEELLDAELADGASIALAQLERLPAALARLVVIRLAEDAAGAFVPQAGAHVGEILALGRRGGRAELHVGGLLRAVVQDGRLRMERLPPRV